MVKTMVKKYTLRCIMILIRCKKCRRYYTTNHPACTNCGNKDAQKDYHIRLNNKDTYAGNSLTVARELDSSMKKAKRLSHIEDLYKKPENITLGEFITDYFAPHFQSKNKRYDRAVYSLNYFCKTLGHKELAKIDSYDIEKAINEKGRNSKPATRNYYLAIIRRVFNYAIEIGKVKTSPVKTKALRFDNRRMRFLNDDDQAALLEACKKSINPKLYPMVMIALHTGMRKGEIQQLAPEDIRDNKIYLRAETTKTTTTRIIPVHPAIKDFLEGYFSYRSDVKRSFVTACNIAQITDFTFHDLRHTFASRLVQRGVDLYTVKELLGHSSLTMTQRYAHLAPDNHMNAINKL